MGETKRSKRKKERQKIMKYLEEVEKESQDLDRVELHDIFVCNRGRLQMLPLVFVGLLLGLFIGLGIASASCELQVTQMQLNNLLVATSTQK